GTTPPSTPESRPPDDGAGDDYLRDAMAKTLAAGDVCYDFFVQRPRSEDADPIENPTKAWEGAFTPVARITIPSGQAFEENADLCERMSFDPHHATDASKPVGKTNMTRKLVYRDLAAFRRTELPALFARWQKNHDDPTIRPEFRRELAKLKD